MALSMDGSIVMSSEKSFTCETIIYVHGRNIIASELWIHNVKTSIKWYINDKSIGFIQVDTETLEHVKENIQECYI